MKKETEYSKKLRDPRWQKKRLEILSRDNFACSICDDSESELHVHHVIYEHGSNPWDSDNNDCVTMCKTCHKRVTKLLKDSRILCTFDPWITALEDLIDIIRSGDWGTVCIQLHEANPRNK